MVSPIFVLQERIIMSKPDNPIHSDINDLFEAYAEAFEKQDAKGMAQLYSIPCTLMSDDASSVYSEEAKLEGLIGQGKRFYKKHGITHAVPDVRHKYVFTNKIAQVKVNWVYYNKENEPVYDCDYQYIARLQANKEWKIEVAVSINEHERIANMAK